METFAMGTTFACHIVLHFSLTDLTLSDDKLFEGKYFSHMSNFETWNMHLDQIGKKFWVIVPTSVNKLIYLMDKDSFKVSQ